MELLLNLIWVVMALGAFCAFLRERRWSARLQRVPYLTALVAIGCMVLLLFPIVSASDDLHPTQAVMEDATKRIQRGAVSAPQHGFPVQLSPAILSLAVWFSFCALQPCRPSALPGRRIDRSGIPQVQRGPPLFAQ